MLSLDYLRQSFSIGIVIFDKEFNILCVNETIERILGFRLTEGVSSSLPELHSKEAFYKITQMIKEAQFAGKSDNYILKILSQKEKKDIILLGKVFTLNGKYKENFIALLYDLTDILIGENKTIIKLPAYEGKDLLLLDIEEIDYLKAAGNYTDIYVCNEKYLSPLPMGKFEKKLDTSNFMRIHRSFIVNLKKIKKLSRERGKYFVLLQNGHKLPISRNRLKISLEKFGLK
ncbi:LytTR family transcriptional regulator [Thermosulfuriphilus ammonigenes]|uniref:LytTR family transcriptional regulator n=1 Tax=Thermosulfuriphilus ammonigenes TaxID=1936021 RepID=A0A6G7PTQ8_9BACT|nr:LytTR family DNA-binding domain-containing protein [Thermosulfuriphilus ammonigenes]MBA2848986.1 PAS domain S-box-containing protein [Thermosulfuriphilus ammonigenes]QIJ70901.1 LytTR family transcriptional regulator [Thermosulfuriphilus ammonigenes]